MDIINSAGSLANVGAVYLAWKSIKITVAEQKRIRLDEKEKTVISQKMLWYNQVVLEDILKQLSQTLEYSEHSIRGAVKDIPLTDEEGRQLYMDIEYNFHMLAEKLMMVKIFDENLYQTCRELQEHLLDCYTLWVEGLTVVNRKDDSIVLRIQDYRNKILETFYKYGNRMVCGI